MNVIENHLGIFRQKNSTEKLPSTWHPEEDSNDYRHLANLLLHNWTRKRSNCVIVNAERIPEFKEVLMQNFESTLVCKSLPSGALLDADLICLIFEVEKSFGALGKALTMLNEEGTLFIRTLKHEETVFKNLLQGPLSQLVSPYFVANELHQVNLSQEGEFYIHEVYDIGKFRDYLIKYRPVKKRTCVGLIVKNEERDLPKLLKSLNWVADAICLIDTGSTDNTLSIFEKADVLNKHGGRVKKHSRVYTEASSLENGEWKLWSFSQARNQYVKDIEEMGYDYVLWMDADDTVMTPQLLKLLHLFEQYSVHGLTMETGSSGWIHHRMWKTKLGIKYEGRCHEYPSIGGHPCMLHPKIVIRHDAAPIPGTEDSNDRNLRILLQAAELEPTPRTHFYLANTYKDRNDFKNAIPWYEKRIQDGVGYYDEYIFALLYKARCERAAGLIENAERTLLQGYQLTKWAEFSMEFCYLYMNQKRFMEAIEWAHKAIQDWDHVIPPTSLWREENKYTDQPYRMLTWCYIHLDKLHSAVKYGKKVLNFVGKDKSWEDLIALTPTPREGKITFQRPGALGDILMCATVLQQYRKENPKKEITFAVHKSLKPMVEPVLILAGADYVCTTEEVEGPVQNLIGYPLNEGYPDKPMQKHLLEYLSREMGVSEAVHSLKLPLPPKVKEGDYATLHPTALWSPYKNWDLNNWAAVISKLNVPVIELGASQDVGVLTGDSSYKGFALNTALALIAHAKFHMGVDSWSNHATNITWEGKGKTPGLILWGSTQSSAAGYSDNKNLTHEVPCQPCFKEDPKISTQAKGACTNNHACMKNISVESVVEVARDLCR